MGAHRLAPLCYLCNSRRAVALKPCVQRAAGTTSRGRLPQRARAPAVASGCDYCDRTVAAGLGDVAVSGDETACLHARLLPGGAARRKRARPTSFSQDFCTSGRHTPGHPAVRPSAMLLATAAMATMYPHCLTHMSWAWTLWAGAAGFVAGPLHAETSAPLAPQKTTNLLPPPSAPSRCYPPTT